MTNNTDPDWVYGEDDEAFAPGTHAISTVRLSGFRGDGTPFVTVTSAVCDVCGAWASEMRRVVRTTTTKDDLENVHVSRRVEIIQYGCPDHIRAIGDALLDEHGYVFLHYDSDDLAAKVAAARPEERRP